MKTSRYNLILREEDGCFIYNSFLNSHARVDEEIASLLSEMEETGQEPPVSRQALEPLIHGGFLVDDGRDELAELKLRNRLARYGPTSFGITFAPTLACNFRCVYCFEGGPPDTASPETLDAVYDFVVRNLQHKTSFGVCWYGGEPLLALDSIRRLSRRFIALCRTLGISYEADIISNGYLMDEPEARLLAGELGVSFWQVTLDGPPDVHDRRRPTGDGKPTFDRILRNLAACHERFPRVSVRINVDRSNHGRVPELLDILGGEGLRNRVNVYFGRVQSFGAVCKSVGATCFSVDEFAAVEAHLNAVAIGKGFAVSTRPALATAYCGADRVNSFVIDPRGRLAKCWNSIGLEGESVGTVYESELNDLYVRWLSYDPFDDPECASCKILPLCMGGCPYERVIGGRKECRTAKTNLVQQLWLRRRAQALTQETGGRDDGKERIEDALKELLFIDEPELDLGLIARSPLAGCIKHCQGGHCGGQTDDCRKQRMCDDKCLGLAGCVKQSGQWCSHQSPDCHDLGACKSKCMGRGVL